MGREPNGRVVLVVEQLEGRAQPSAVPTAPTFLLPDPTGPAARGSHPDPAPGFPGGPASPAGEATGPGRLTPAATAPAATTTPRHELVLIDFGVPERDALARDLLAAPGPDERTTYDVVELHGGGVAEVTDILRRYHGLDAVHVVSHGTAGALHLGSDRLTASTVGGYAQALREWHAALNPGADLLLYGCDVAATSDGRQLVAGLGGLTGADVAASTDPTGAAALGGDWRLEYDTGPVEARVPFDSGVRARWGHTLGETAGSLLLTTKGDVSSAGTPGLASWADHQVLRFGTPNLTLEPGVTGGTVSSLFDLGNFGGAGVPVDSVHYVRHRVAVGGGTAAATLLPGDLLLSTGGGATLTGTDPRNTLTVTKDDVFVFRPAAPGDYSAGTFFMLLDNFGAITGGNDTRAVALVEADTRVGDAFLPKGSFLFARGGGSQDDNVTIFIPTAVGAGTTGGTTAVLIDGAQLGINAPVRGLDLIATPTTIAGRVLPAGTVLMALDAAARVGTNRLSVTQFDAFTLDVTRTTLVAGTASATADLLFQGGDIGLSGSGEKFAALSLGPTTSPPVAAPDAYTTAENATLTVPAAGGLLANDTDPAGGTLTAALATGPAHGSVTVNPDGSFTYTPAPNYSGSDSFAYTATDSRGGTATGTVALTVTPVNYPPVARDDAYSTGFGVLLTVVGGNGVLANDTDVDGDSLTASLVGGPANGVLTLLADGSFVYVPNPGFVGTDSFTYAASDGYGGASTAAATIAVGLGNRPPTAADDAYTTAEDARLAGRSVLANDADPDGDPMTAVLVTGPAHGALTLNPDGTFVYTPNPDYNGPDSFTYLARDPRGAASGVATVALTVTPVNDPPTLAPVPDLTIAEDAGRQTVTLTGISAGGGENQPLTVAATSSNGALFPALAVGYVSPGTTGTLSFQPAPSANGAAVITVTVGDGITTTSRSFVVAVTPVNHPPVANDDAFTAGQNAALTMSAPGVLGNDTDVDADLLAASLVAGPRNGTLSLAADGSFTYTPAAGFSGSDTFTYRASDGILFSGLATVTIAVPPAATPPLPPPPAAPPPPATGTTSPPVAPPAPSKPPGAGVPSAAGSPPGSPTKPPGADAPGSPTSPPPAGPPALGDPTPETTPAPAATASAPTGTTNSAAGGGTAATTAVVVIPAGVGDAGRLPAAVPAADPGIPQPVPAPAVSDSSPAPPVTTAPDTRPAPVPLPTATAPPVGPSVPVVSAPPPATELAPTDPVFDALDRVAGDLRGEVEDRVLTDAVVTTGVVATAGYVLLNTRAVYWFLSALLARPAVWRRFDPLDVIYAWERDRATTAPSSEEDDSLQAMVGTRPA